jgi:hypothetical protein
MKTFIHILALSAVLILPGCRKPGCTDPNADNYSETAKPDDGSCYYSGSAVFWYKEATAKELYTDGSYSLYYFLEDKFVGTSTSEMFWKYEPDCGQQASVTVLKDLGSQPTRSYNYYVLDQHDRELWSGELNISGNECTKIELIY